MIDNGEPKAEIVGQEQLSEVRNFFGDSASIVTAPERDGFLVELILADGEMIPGGQRVKLQLGSKKIQEVTEVYGDKKVGLGEAYKIEVFEVGGQNLLEEPISGFLIPGNEDSPRIDMAYYPGQLVVFNRMKTGDDLAAFLHEKGHLREEGEKLDPDYLENKKMVTFGIEHLLGYLKTFKMSREVVSGFLERIPLEGLKRMLTEEHRASKLAIDEINKRRIEQGDLFPGDPTLARVKLFFAKEISSYMGGGDFPVKWGKLLGDSAKELQRFD